MKKQETSRITKLDYANWILTCIALIVSGISLYWNYSEKETWTKLRLETLLDEAFDFMAGAEGKPLEGATEAFDQGSIDARQLELAKRRVDEAYILDPENPRVIRFKADILRLSGQRVKAIEEFEKALALQPSIGGYNSLGRTYFETNQLDHAIDAFNKALELDSKNPNVLLNLGNTFLQQKRYEEAISSFEKALSVYPECINCHVSLGIAFLMQEKVQEAINEFSNALTLDRKNPDIYINLGVAYGKVKRREDAVNCYEMAIQLDPSDPLVYNNLGECLIHMKRYDDAKRNLEFAIFLDQEFPWAYQNLHLLYTALGNKKKANEFKMKYNQVKASTRERPKLMYRVTR